MALQDTRPVFLNLLKIKLPLMGLVSIGHRITGVLLFLSIPVLLYLLGLSLSGEAGFAQAVTIIQSLTFKLFALLVIWSLMHHLLAGIRYLLLDLDIGVQLPQARTSAITVFIGGLLLALAGGFSYEQTDGGVSGLVSAASHCSLSRHLHAPGAFLSAHQATRQLC